MKVEAPSICRQMTSKGGKVVNCMHRPPLPPRRYPWYSFMLEAESTSGPQCGNSVYQQNVVINKLKRVHL